MAQKLSVSEFIARAQATHGHKYDYSRVRYDGNAKKVEIICSVHGVFEQVAASHMNGCGCKYCAGMGKLSTARFLQKAIAVHGKKYDYSQSVYINSKAPVKIICPTHGAFEQAAGMHTAGQGCNKCSLIRKGVFRAKGLAAFIAEARRIHGNKYDYSEAQYIRGDKKVKIICPTHGEFEQRPANHITGQGCARCGDKRAQELQSLGLSKFLELSKTAHGNKYDYSQAVYINSKTPVKIICPAHGAFEQVADSHMNGHGCSLCSSLLEWVKIAAGRQCILYFLHCTGNNESFYKVGITCTSVNRRYASSNSIGPYQYEIIALHRSNNSVAVFEWEQSILKTFAHLRYRPKLPFNGATECFSSCDEILAIFPL